MLTSDEIWEANRHLRVNNYAMSAISALKTRYYNHRMWYWNFELHTWLVWW